MKQKDTKNMSVTEYGLYLDEITKQREKFDLNKTEVKQENIDISDGKDFDSNKIKKAHDEFIRRKQIENFEATELNQDKIDSDKSVFDWFLNWNKFLQSKNKKLLSNIYINNEDNDISKMNMLFSTGDILISQILDNPDTWFTIEFEFHKKNLSDTFKTKLNLILFYYVKGNLTHNHPSRGFQNNSKNEIRVLSNKRQFHDV